MMSIRKSRTIVLIALCFVLLLSGCGKRQEAAQEQKQETAGKIPVETVKTEDFSMKYCRFGEGKRTLVILPGLSIQSVMGSADAIAEAYQQLTNDFTIYVFEPREKLPKTYSVSDMAEDAAAAIETLGIGPVSLFGASYGGMASMTLAVNHPELVEKMILASTSADVTEEQFQTIEGWIRLAEEGDAEKLYLAFGEAVYPEKVFQQSKDLLTNAAKEVTKEDLKRFIILAEGIKGFNITEKLDQVKCPVFVIGDQQDDVLGAAASETIVQHMEQHPGFERYMYDGYGHAVYDLAPDFKERVLTFLQQE